MDVNGTRFHILLTRQDWERQQLSLSPASELPGVGQTLTPDFDWDDSRLSLGLRRRLFRFPAPPGDKALQWTDRRGAGRDRYGNWYWIDENETELRFRGAAGQQAEHFWSAEDLAKKAPQSDDSGDFQPDLPPSEPTPFHFRGLAVTDHHYLVVGLLDQPGLLIFDLHAGGTPLQKNWPVPFAPFDMVPAPDGGVWILDFDPTQPGYVPRYWALDRYFRVVGVDQPLQLTEPGTEDDFQPEADPGDLRGKPQRLFPGGLSLALSSPLAVESPLAIEALPDGTVLILAHDLAADDLLLYRYRFGEQVGQAASVREAAADYLADLPALGGHDFAVIPDDQTEFGLLTGSLYLATADGNQAYAFRLTIDDANLTLELDLIPDYFPMRLFSGKGLVAAGGLVYYDLQDRWLPLARQPRPRYKTAGQIETEIFDGRDFDCVWHRLFIDACLPSDTAISIESRAANDLELLGQTAWQSEPPLYHRGGGPELPFYQPFSGELAGREDAGTWELLFQQARGRFLQVRLVIDGNGQRTPWLRALRVYYPRFSYLRAYLPAVYQQDEVSASFLDRFLANVEGLYTALEGKIEQVQGLFDPAIVPPEYLDWLAGWFGVTLEQEWDEAKRRLFLKHAIELFNQRGTPAGIIRAIRLALDPCPDESLFSEDVTACSSGNALACAAEQQTSPFSVRIIERFMSRSQPGVIYGDPTDTVGPGLTTLASDWSPAQGAAPLHQRYRDFLQGRYPSIEALSAAWEQDLSSFTQILLSPVLPVSANAAAIADWRSFTQRQIGFYYSEVTAADEAVYRQFLAQRYKTTAALNSAYGRNYDSFEAVKLPAEADFPNTLPRLYDWIQFVSLILPLTGAAHRFTVLVPTPLQADRTVLSEQLELVRRIVELEKPAHTSFEVRQYWAMFRVGEARLGLDTVLDVGSRFAALVLGSGHLAGGYLAAPPPWNVQDRIVAGRDQVGGHLVVG